MRTRLMTTLVMVASLLVSGQTLAQPPQLPNFQSGDVLRASDLNLIVEQVKKNTNGSGGSSGGTTHTVDCSSGTIAAAMSQAQPGDTIMISGTCNEAVVVDKDGITLDGGGSAVIDGMNDDTAVILIRGQQGVTIKGLTVQNGLNGIKIVESAAARLQDVTVQNSRLKTGHDSAQGIVVSGSASAVMMGNIAANDNDGIGIGAWNSSSIFVVGNIVVDGIQFPRASLQANNNDAFGIEIGRGSSLHAASGDSTPAVIQANNNGGIGINVAHAASVQFGGGADVEANDNGDSGLSIGNGSAVMFQTYGDPSRGVTARFNRNQGWAGISVYDHSSLVLLHFNEITASITAENNTGVGIGVGQNSSARFVTSLPQSMSASVTFSNNGSYGGVAVYQNATVAIRTPAEISGNTNDGVNIWGDCFVELGLDTDGAVTVNDNGGNGITASLASVLALDGVTIEDNSGNGVGIYDNGELSTFGGATTIGGNGGDGISAWNGVGIYLGNATVTGNTGVDVSSGRGSRIGWSNSTVGSVGCSAADTVAFDDAMCPDQSGQ